MEVQSENTGRIVAIQHDLVMSIGLDLDLNRMLTFFLHSCLNRLEMSSAHLFVYASPAKGEGLQHFMSLPSQNVEVPGITDNAHSISSTLRPVFSSHKDTHEVTFSLKNLGFLVLRKSGTALDELVAYSLIPVMDRLAVSCQACLDHQNILNEIEARRQAEAAVLRQASLDSLTNLPNRRALYQRLSSLLRGEDPDSSCGAVLFIDVDRFKYINDTLGHLIGDELLIKVAEILGHNAREGDFIARLASDEFVMVINRQNSNKHELAEVAQTIAGRIIDATGTPLALREYKLNVGFSIGISLFPQNLDSNLCAEANAENLVRFADTAMYAAKKNGRDRYMLFSSEMQARNESRLRIEKALTEALENGEMEMHYQVIVAPSGKILGGESLVRWNSPELGFVSPAEFIPIAEESGLIREIGEWTVRDACALIRKINHAPAQRYPTFEYLSVNVSPRQFKHPSFARNIIAIVEESGISPDQLRLEVTEGVAIDNIDDTIKKMQILLDYGIKFSLDDFGTGYSSLSYLHKLPLHTIKIDRAFVTDINEHPENQAIVDATVAMAEHMGKKCIIEGVETQDDLAYFQGIGIDAMQGYYFSRPVNETEFLDLLKKRAMFDHRKIAALTAEVIPYKFRGSI
ncbi:EAL domain-containing protein [Granulosicoccaceae sp. 1_MG-2023]|nr:EAL domain-containing protein [Granulosicoccaceae sp. 1_MG-2023]